MTKISNRTIDNMVEVADLDDINSLEDLSSKMAMHFFEKGFDIDTTKEFLKYIVEQSCNTFDEMNKETLKDLEEDKLAKKK